MLVLDEVQARRRQPCFARAPAAIPRAGLVGRLGTRALSCEQRITPVHFDKKTSNDHTSQLEFDKGNAGSIAPRDWPFRSLKTSPFSLTRVIFSICWAVAS